MTKLHIYTYGAAGHEQLPDGLKTCHIYGWCQAPTEELAKDYATRVFHHEHPGAKLGDVGVKQHPELAILASKLN